jgi:hypothetical protein
LNDAENATTVEPMVAYRGVKGFDNIFDAGANLNMPEYRIKSIRHVPHQSSATVALGLDLKSLALLFAFSDNMGALNQYASNTFELGLKLRLLDSK